LAEQGSELFEPRHAQGHLAERQGCSGRERQLALAFGTFPVETRDGEMQRAVALAIDTGGERERRAQEIALRRDLSVGRRWNILEPQRGGDRRRTDRARADLRGYIGGERRMLGRAGDAALGIDRAEKLRRERREIGERQRPCAIERVARERAVRRGVQRLAVEAEAVERRRLALARRL